MKPTKPGALHQPLEEIDMRYFPKTSDLYTRILALAAPAALALALTTLILTAGLAVPAFAANPDDPSRARSPNNPMVDLEVLRETAEQRRPGQGGNPDAAVFPEEFRSIDGSGNNADNPLWGSAGVPFLRLTRVSYADGADEPAGGNRPSPREVSNLCVAQSESTLNGAGVSDFLWQWGQFLDHDIDLTPEVEPEQEFDIEVPLGDPFFDPFSTGTVTIPLNRSLYETVDGVRQQMNLITAFIDASNVYGSDDVRAAALRANDGTGRLATSDGNLLPFNTEGLPNAAMGNPEDFFLAGDFRANEQAGLLAMHTLFMREHNFWADRLREDMPELSGDEIYEYARAIVGGEMQAITYREFLPLLLGRDALRPYRGYRPGVDAGIANVFATAAYRFGHSMLSNQILRLDSEGEEIAAGHLSLADAFFSPDLIIDDGIAPLLRGLASQRAQEIDNQLVDEVRNFLFGPPGAGGFDLASLNIQRGRDHGLASYNQVRAAMDLRPLRRLEQINSDPEVAERLREAYGEVRNVDAWVGGLAEEHARGALVGETWQAVLADQFERLRDGDRFWYESYLPPFLVNLVEDQTLARIIRRNTDIGSEISNNPFRVPRSPE